MSVGIYELRDTDEIPEQEVGSYYDPHEAEAMDAAAAKAEVAEIWMRAAEGLRRILTVVYADDHGRTRPITAKDLPIVMRRFLVLTFMIDDQLLGGMSLSKIAGLMGVSKQVTSQDGMALREALSFHGSGQASRYKRGDFGVGRMRGMSAPSVGKVAC